MPSPVDTTPDQLNSSLQRGFADLWDRFRQGSTLLAAFGIAGLILSALSGWWLNRDRPSVTSVKVAFSYPGAERGLYPDGSEFQPQDLRALPLLQDALRALQLEPSAEQLRAVQAALSVKGVIAREIVADRDRVRGTGERPPAFVPDEYRLSLGAVNSLNLSSRQKTELLTALIDRYTELFTQTYAQLPQAIGEGFGALDAADFSKYELILNTEVRKLTTFLREQAARAGTFRSRATSLSFQDLVEQTELFSRLHLNETLGVIYEFGLSRDRNLAMSKLDYQIKLLEEREHWASEEEGMINELLQLTQSRGRATVLAVPSSRQARDHTTLDQGLIDSLVENDSYNLLIREALAAGLRTREIQMEQVRLLALRDNMRSFLESDQRDQTAAVQKTQASLAAMRAAFDRLIELVVSTYADYASEQFGDSVRISQSPVTTNPLRPVLFAAASGGFLGLCLGAGLALLGVSTPRRRDS